MFKSNLKLIFCSLASIFTCSSLIGAGWYVSIKATGGKHITLAHIKDDQWISNWKSLHGSDKGACFALRDNVKRAVKDAIKKFWYKSITLTTDDKTVYFGGPSIVQKINYNQSLWKLRELIVTELINNKVPYSNNWKFAPHITIKRIKDKVNIGQTVYPKNSFKFKINSIEYNSPYEEKSYWL